MKYIFQLRTTLSDRDREPDIEALYNAGLDDCTISMRDGFINFTFAREADSKELAMALAIQDIHSVYADWELHETDY